VHHFGNPGGGGGEQLAINEVGGVEAGPNVTVVM